MKQFIEQLEHENKLPPETYKALLEGYTSELAEFVFSRAQATREKYYGRTIYLRGLIEFTNHCQNDCYYCGIRKSNRDLTRYRLTPETILACCHKGYQLGFRTFVLQGGEDGYFQDEKLIPLIEAIKTAYPDCALTLSIGEKSYSSYLAYYKAGADRYLLRHETANTLHYSKLHPKSLTLSKRLQCLNDLKDIGYQVGMGFMVGSPYQSIDCLVEDLLLIERFKPEMVGIGPFIPHHATPFAKEVAGSIELTFYLIGLIRLMHPRVLLPATTALGTLDPNGREKGILAGANVLMPNLSPVDVRKNYLLYDNKICTGEEAAECQQCLKNRMENIGYQIVVSRGDYTTSPSVS
ncbi:[FeFe] hydrogenase H-cluster radical SAM maturase HydE [Sporanaerobium hydrogeniformans]|uniref:[FeFe] hydrogenase H-cluster radical SAM maturase HydE n=1 Tax=Sporanaerobium hydrogeniformans TaxID=3072179 RepID=A0AC61DDA3_9FIRM|nr:[FeFe] hydrogenase H-cluster radical SAM maturase HydE [Sporanaerobium hydrogeniformans]PHV70721.1 [FeFe] hydrogenase H-cluster radical SAM maturase HydE [Sporanaerobium hydrogeniformans]